MNPRPWTDPNGKTRNVWLVSPVGLVTEGDKPPTSLGADPQSIMFTDPENPAHHPSVRYTSDKPLPKLKDEEIREYWEQIEH